MVDTEFCSGGGNLFSQSAIGSASLPSPGIRRSFVTDHRHAPLSTGVVTAERFDVMRAHREIPGGRLGAFVQWFAVGEHQLVSVYRRANRRTRWIEALASQSASGDCRLSGRFRNVPPPPPPPPGVLLRVGGALVSGVLVSGVLVSGGVGVTGVLVSGVLVSGVRGRACGSPRPEAFRVVCPYLVVLLRPGGKLGVVIRGGRGGNLASQSAPVRTAVVGYL